MFCPKCRSEYRPGITTCAHCKIALVAELPPEDVFASMETMARSLEGKDVTPLMLGGLAALQESQDYLRERRVATMMAPAEEGEQESAIHAQFHLMIAREDVERARAALEERWQSGVEREGLLLGEAPQVGTCPACGASVPETASECPDCGLFLGEAG